MKQIANILIILVFSLPTFPNAYLNQGRADGQLLRRTMFLEGRERLYFVYSPPSRTLKATRPVVFVLHGGGGADAYEMAKRTRMNFIADREDFIVVYPYGVDGQWNDGRGISFRRLVNNKDIDDVGFISAIIDELIQTAGADPRRIYVVGMSNGGMMAYRLGIELGHRLTAIAAIIANLPVNLSNQKPVRPLPVLIMNGTADPMMPWKGGPVRVLRKEYGEVLSTDETVQYWLRATGLEKVQPETKKLENRTLNDRSTVEVDIYRDSQRRLEIVLYRIVGGGHNLPGGQTPDRPLLLGPKNMDINAMEEVWAFFKRHINETPAKPPEPAFNPQTWKIKIEQVGDPKANYLNVEFTMNGRYMVWFEGKDEIQVLLAG